MKPRNRQISHLTEIKSKSSDGRQMIYGNRQIPSPVEHAADGPNRKAIVKRLPVIVNPGTWNPATIRRQSREINRLGLEWKTVILESADYHLTSPVFRPVISPILPIINRRKPRINRPAQKRPTVGQVQKITGWRNIYGGRPSRNIRNYPQPAGSKFATAVPCHIAPRFGRDLPCCKPGKNHQLIVNLYEVIIKRRSANPAIIYWCIGAIHRRASNRRGDGKRDLGPRAVSPFPVQSIDNSSTELWNPSMTALSNLPIIGQLNSLIDPARRLAGKYPKKQALKKRYSRQHARFLKSSR